LREYLKGRYTLDIFACDIAIKRYEIKKTFFIKYFFPVCIENIFFGQFLIFWNVITIFWRKSIFLSKCLFFKMSFYLFITILCVKMSRVNKHLQRENGKETFQIMFLGSHFSAFFASLVLIQGSISSMFYARLFLWKPLCSFFLVVF